MLPVTVHGQKYLKTTDLDHLPHMLKALQINKLTKTLFVYIQSTHSQNTWNRCKPFHTGIHGFFMPNSPYASAGGQVLNNCPNQIC